jgi:2-polyprenyl-3-methyl-5-hydroxy-6-metoxy-1,4-benzoquinol methylase
MKPITNRDNIRAWSSVSRQMIEEFGEEGDASRRFILNPVLFALLGDVAGRHVLDAGCGTGYLCRLLAKQGAVVTGLEPATPLFEYAVEREEQDPLGITYIQQDLSEWPIALATFDIVVANMVFMDIPDYQPAMHNCIAGLKSGGHFLFSLLHPCFDEISSPAFEQSYRAKGYIRIDEYFDEFVTEQTWGYHFHRPLSSYLNHVIDEGCLIQRVIEPKLPEEGAEVLGEGNRNMHVPNFIVIAAIKCQ